MRERGISLQKKKKKILRARSLEPALSRSSLALGLRSLEPGFGSQALGSDAFLRGKFLRGRFLRVRGPRAHKRAKRPVPFWRTDALCACAPPPPHSCAGVAFLRGRCISARAMQRVRARRAGNRRRVRREAAQRTPHAYLQRTHTRAALSGPIAEKRPRARVRGGRAAISMGCARAHLSRREKPGAAPRGRRG